MEFERAGQAAGRAATPGPHAPDPANNPQPAVTLEELEEDPQYQCVRAQIDPPHQNLCCRSCRNCSTRSEQLQSNKLQRAYDTGWAMLMSNIFPLAPNYILRCFWVLCQLIFAISLVGLSSQPVTGHNYNSYNC